MRISSTARSAEWIAAEYANQNDPDTFYSISTQRQVSAAQNAYWF